jgi:iron complex outermembrane receptor protein
MLHIKKPILSILFLLLFIATFSQAPISSSTGFVITVINEQSQPMEGVTVELLQNNKLVKAAITDEKGTCSFENILSGPYTFSITYAGYQNQVIDTIHFPSVKNNSTVILKPTGIILQEVTVSKKKQFIKHTSGKTILNIDAAVTNVGTTVLEVLEKSPGVMVDRNGGLTLQGKAGVLLLIDDKQTYLSGAELNNMLSSMSSAQVEQIELMTNPPARYDASGNAGIINIKTKKGKTKGFNGSFTVTGSQGVYPKNSNSLSLNYRTGKVNLFLTYSMNLNKYLSDLYALRKYYSNNGALTAVLNQPTYFSGFVFNNSLKTGIDYFASSKTTIGIVLSGSSSHRDGNSEASAIWLNASNRVDSSVSTTSTSDNSFKNGSININLHHTISARQEIAVDLDWLNYDIRSQQYFNNELLTSGGYKEASQGNIPSAITILSGKTDHTLHLGKSTSLQSGWKSSYISTDNIASYQNLNGMIWEEDFGKSNHFIYKENIHALYTSLEGKLERFNLQGGLRYEYTTYNAHQLGNVQQNDSAFSRNYGAIFPSGSVRYRLDSSNDFTFTVGRRIDRPAFQSLNPFFFIVNKYTYETGNPFILPQFSWSLELGHQYKDLLSSNISYSIIKNYFSQLFLTDAVSGILLYSQGNVGSVSILGLSSTLTFSPLGWWLLNLQSMFNYKRLKGFNGNAHYTSNINQLNLNFINQFTFAKVYTAELSGFYTTRARNDLQELLYPTGQLSIGISRPVLKKKGTIKLSARDIFYTNAMEGLTHFPNATEYFIIRRDTRVLNLAFVYRFGKAYTIDKRSGSSADEEMERVESGR